MLRPNLLSLYKTQEEAELQLSITLSDVTAVASVSKSSKREHVFGVFSPSRNYHFQALSQKDAESWVESISTFCEDSDLDPIFVPKSRLPTRSRDLRGDSDCENSELRRRPETTYSQMGNKQSRISSFTQDYSGNDITSASEFSDTGAEVPLSRASSSSPRSAMNSKPSSTTDLHLPDVHERGSYLSPMIDSERIIYNGYVLLLKNNKGVRQWKRLWAVLRPHALYFYKDEHEYRLLKKIEISQVITAAETDPLSRSKTLCFQVITQTRAWRCCVDDEESLVRWLGALKSVVTRKSAVTKRLRSIGRSVTDTNVEPRPCSIQRNATDPIRYLNKTR